MLTVVIVCYNSAATLQKCQHELLASQRFPVIIVDNASRDGSADTLAARYPHVQIIRLDRNQGYGRAANRGLRAVTTPYGFLLNPDMITTPDAMQAMLEFAQKHDGEASVFTAAVVSRDFRREGAIPRDWVVGAAMMFRMQDFSELGFFDENLFLFEEDADLSWRVIASGRKMLLNSDLLIRHLEGQSSEPNPKIDALKDWHVGWSRMYFQHKHGLIAGWWPPRRMWLKYQLKALVAVKPASRRRYRARAAGIMAYLRGEKAFLADGRAQGTDKL